MKLSKKQFDEFVKHYNWKYLQDPSYRVGQAFLNYFPAYERHLLEDGDHGHMEATKLWNNASAEWCWSYISRFVQE